MIRIRLHPLGRTLEVEPGTALQDVLFGLGVEFPCGGRGRCRGCRVRVIEGDIPATDEDVQILGPVETSAGWRLACRSRISGDATLEIRQWEAAILADDTPFAFAARQGTGIAVDLGTTTVVGQLVDQRTGQVLAVERSLNPQFPYGSDIMTRVEYACSAEGKQKLQCLIRGHIGALVQQLLAGAGISEVDTVVIAGNTVMHHLFCGLDIAPLAHYPFAPGELDGKRFSASQLGWQLRGNPSVQFLPCIGGFVGSDILAGILATRIHEAERLSVLVDLGTNGEVVVGNRDRMLCASTAAGPAFEGARIEMGMQAATGAISEVRLSDGRLQCHVLGGGAPRGLCGSGLVDSVSAGLELGVIQSNGRLKNRTAWELCSPVRLTQNDIRELQLAKGAIAAAISILLQRWGADSAKTERVYLAGAFGNYINRASARRIGLIDFPEDKVTPAGNTALLGAKIALFEHGDEDYAALRRRITHVPLAADKEFENIFVDAMLFPL